MLAIALRSTQSHDHVDLDDHSALATSTTLGLQSAIKPPAMDQHLHLTHGAQGCAEEKHLISMPKSMT